MPVEGIFGPMYSGKTSELMRKIKMWLIANKKIFVIKHVFDDSRYGQEKIITHDQISYPSISVKSLQDVENNMEFKNADCVFIDEGQFFDDIYLVDKWGDTKNIYVSSLSGTFERKSWPNINTLIPLCDTHIFLRAVCQYCKTPDSASYTYRIANTKEDIFIGSTNDYIALCRSCYKKH
jgi:thymidine kinase